MARKVLKLKTHIFVDVGDTLYQTGANITAFCFAVIAHITFTLPFIHRATMDRTSSSEIPMTPGAAPAAVPATSPQIPVADALAEGLMTMLTPMVNKCDDHIQQALDSQAALAQQLDRVAAELQAFLSASTLPSFSPHAQRLSDLRRRIAAANSTMIRVQMRLEHIEEMADHVESQVAPSTAVHTSECASSSVSDVGRGLSLGMDHT